MHNAWSEERESHQVHPSYPFIVTDNLVFNAAQSITPSSVLMLTPIPMESQPTISSSLQQAQNNNLWP